MAEVYGNQFALPLPEALRPVPISPYGASKLIGEHYGGNFSLHYGLETVSLRYFARFIVAARQRVPLEIHGDGKQTRDFTYVGNVVEANLVAAEAPGVAGEVFNVACGERLSVLDIASQLEEVLGRSLSRRHTPPRAGDVRDTLADVSKARERLGYRPRVGFPEGLRRTVAAFSA